MEFENQNPGLTANTIKQIVVREVTPIIHQRVDEHVNTLIREEVRKQLSLCFKDMGYIIGRLQMADEK